VEPLLPKKAAQEGEALTADLLYEVWDEQQRKLHLQVKNVIPLRKWVHIVITTANQDAFAPSIAVYANGVQVHKEEKGTLPATNDTKNNFVGRSNWANATSQLDNADELFKGRLFDFRGYRVGMTEKKIQRTVKWGRDLLGIAADADSDSDTDSDSDADADADAS
jgi:hypothetical protein